MATSLDEQNLSFHSQNPPFSEKCTLAHDVIKAKLPKLVEKIPPEEISDELWSASIISEEEYEFSFDKSEPRKERTRKLIRKVMQAIKKNYEVFERFCYVLEQSENKGIQEWSKRLKDDLEQQLKDSTRTEVSSELTTENEALKRLKDELAIIRKSLFQSDDNLDAKYDLAKEFITRYIVRSMDSTLFIDEELKDRAASVKEQLRKLCFEEFLIPTKLHQWCLHEMKKLGDARYDDPIMVPEGSQMPISVVTPLFNKETVYHALLLSKVVQTCKAKNYETFLAHEHHDFDEVSLSLESADRSNCIEKYAIAKRGKVLYAAFFGEQNISNWQDKYTTINDGIAHQTNRIPIRFFIENIREGYQVIFTGFSFGGLLAVAMHSFLWRQTCLSMDELEKSIACVAFAPPLVDVDVVTDTLVKYPLIKENTYIFYSKNDFFPQMFRCVNRNNIATDISPSNGKLRATNAVGSAILKHLAELQANFFHNKLPSDEAQQILLSLKVALKDGLTTSVTLKLFGSCHLMYPNGSSGHHVLSVLSHQAGEDHINTLNDALIDEIHGDIFKQHSFAKYESLVDQSYFQNPEYGSKVIYRKEKVITVLTEAKPSVSGIIFSRLGDEIAVAVEGDNLWFCDQIKLGSLSGSRVINTCGSDASKRSINFNYVPSSDGDLLVEHKAETVEVCLYSHFCNPIRKKDVKATKKGDYHISLRQRQLARNTPLQIIILAFISAMLEKSSANTSKPSHRFSSISRFFEDVVRIVPVESICHAIINTENKNAWKCAEAFVCSRFDPPPSLQFVSGLEGALMRLTLGVHPFEVQRLSEQAVKGAMQKTVPRGFTESWKVETELLFNKDEVFITAVPQKLENCRPEKVPDKASFARHLSHTVALKREQSDFFGQSDKSDYILHHLQRMRDQVYCRYRQEAQCSNVKVICNLNIDEIYPAKVTATDAKSKSLKPPIDVLVLAKKKLNELQTKAESEILLSFKEGENSVNKAKALHNERMVRMIDDIIENELIICVSLLGAFMQQQICVPFINSPKETAHILQTTKVPPTVGVWALFSLDMLDLQNMLGSKKGKGLIVEVENYIQGILSKIDEDRYLKDDPRYAGKLQFLMQGMVSSVSCNTSYISYSLELQLLDLCRHFKISPSTRVEDLVKEWNKKFKGCVLFHVMQPYRPLLARWLIWSLNIHQLREELASHTTVGVIGLTNSGKSSLVSSLFKQKVITGTTLIQRTTIPFLYNLDGLVDGLSVIDFPGVDDYDKSVKDLTKLLLQLAQIIVLVIDYRRCSTDSAKAMLDYLDREGVPVLLCLTHADKLYANECLKVVGRDCPEDTATRMIGKELDKIKQKIGTSTSRTMDFFSFCQDGDSILNCDEGRETLKRVGIYSTSKVGEWIEKELRDHMQHEKIAEALHKFLSEPSDAQESIDQMPLDLSDDDDETKPLPEHIRGVTISAETTKEFISHNATATFEWEGYGFKIVVPAGALPSGKRCKIRVKAITAGQFNFPKNTELVSSVYWIYSSCKFLKPVDICIDHCAILQSLDDCSQMRFILARCDQESLPYNFSVKPGTFSPNNREGLISLKSFSFLAAIRNYIFPTTAVTGDVQDVAQTNRSYYVVKVFGRSAVSKKKTWQFDFIFMKDIGPYKKAVDTKYCGWIEEIPDLPFEFKGESLEIHIPEKDAYPGWHIATKSPQEISKRYIDDSTPDSSPQSCRLAFRWRGEGEPPPLDCNVELHGTVRKCHLSLSLPIEETSTRSTSLMPVSEHVDSQPSVVVVEGPKVDNSPNINVNVNAHFNN